MNSPGGQLLSYRPHSPGQSRSGAPGPVAAWFKKKKKHRIMPAGAGAPFSPGGPVDSPGVDSAAAAHALGSAQSKLLRLIVKGWCYFPHFRGAKYCKKQFCRFSLPTGRCVHSSSMSSYKQQQDLLDELLFRLRSSIRNCPKYKSIRVWVPPPPIPEPELVLPDTIPLPPEPVEPHVRPPEFVPPKDDPVGPQPPKSEFTEMKPKRANVEAEDIAEMDDEDDLALSSDSEGDRTPHRGERAGGSKGSESHPGAARSRTSETAQDSGARVPPPEEEPLPPFMPPRLIFRNKPKYIMPEAEPFPELIDSEQFIVEQNSSQQQLAGFSPVFVLDVSGTMAGRPIEDVRAAMTLLLHEKGTIAAAIRKGAGFNMCAFSWGAEWWMDRPVQFTERNMRMACTWVSQWPGKGASNALDALQLCYTPNSTAMPSPSAIFLLTDGMLDRKMHVLKAIRSRSGDSGSVVPVHVIACGDHAANAAFLSRIAEESQGTYTAFHRNANGVKALEELQATVVHNHRCGALDGLSALRGHCAAARNMLVKAKVDETNRELIKAWEERNAQRRAEAYAAYQEQLNKARERFDEECQAEKHRAEIEYRDLCCEIARKNHLRRLMWEEQNRKALARERAAVEKELRSQDKKRRVIAERRHRQLADLEARQMEAQIDFERRCKAWEERKTSHKVECEKRQKEWKKHKDLIDERNKIRRENAEREHKEAHEAARNEAMEDYNTAMLQWEAKVAGIQNKNKQIVAEKLAEHERAVKAVKQQNEDTLKNARDEFEEEIAAIQYFNASIQPVVKKADRAQMLIESVEKFSAAVNSSARDFSTTVEVPVIVNCMQRFFPDDSARMLVEAFEEHFTAEELRTRSFYPFYHHHFLKSKSEW